MEVKIMRRRLYFVLPDLNSAQAIEKELLLAKIDDTHIHFMAQEGVGLGKLHVASLFQKTDLVHGMEVGLVVGGLTGLLAGTGMYLVPDVGSMLGVGMIAVLSILGAVVGTWVSGMIAVSIPNSRLIEFQSAIDEGKILLMVDVPYHQIRTIKRMVMDLHPEAESRGLDHQTPAFP